MNVPDIRAMAAEQAVDYLSRRWNLTEELARRRYHANWILWTFRPLVSQT